MLPKAMHAMRSLLCRSTNETPHERLLSFQRKAMFGPALPSWLLSSGTTVLLRRFVRNKSDPMCDTVELISANQTYARVRTQEGRESTVFTSDLAPFPIQTGLIPNEDGSNPIERTTLLHEPANCDNDTANTSSEQNTNLSDIQNTSGEQNEESSLKIESPQPQLRRSNRQRRPPERYGY